jgi:Icc-related predicted phosphoesterase
VTRVRVHVISDVHGNAEALSRAAGGADALVVLGDLIDFVDYVDHGKGILGALFGADRVRTFARLRREGNPAQTVAYARSLWDSLADPAGAVDEAIRMQYAELFSAMDTVTAPVYATPGNVDAPGLWSEFAGDGVRVLDGDVALLGGLRFGFIGGGLLPDGTRRRANAAWVPYLRYRDEFDADVGKLGEVDVLCSHIPPAVPELTYDTVARRFEAGSTGLLDLINRTSPRWSLYGHVHQPLVSGMRIGRTECRNVGHFKQTEAPFVLRW